MNEFRMKAAPRYPDGSRGEPFASVSARGLVLCFGAMAAEVARWLPWALASTAHGQRPSALELTLEWEVPDTPTPTSHAPEAPGASGRRNGRPPRRGLFGRARRRLSCVADPAPPLRAPTAPARARARA